MENEINYKDIIERMINWYKDEQLGLIFHLLSKLNENDHKIIWEWMDTNIYDPKILTTFIKGYVACKKEYIKMGINNDLS